MPAGASWGVHRERLLGARTPGVEEDRHPAVFTGVVIAAIISLALAAWILSALLPRVHSVLEGLIG